jgi:lysyl-tRNA synthetase class 2
LIAEQKQRKETGKDVYDIDQEFIDALEHMPPSGGIAMGVDRIVSCLTSCQKIDDMLVLPASQLFAE